MKEEFERSADGSETVDVDREATIMNLIRENNRQHDRIKELEAIYIAAEAHVDRLRAVQSKALAILDAMQICCRATECERMTRKWEADCDDSCALHHVHAALTGHAAEQKTDT